MSNLILIVIAITLILSVCDISLNDEKEVSEDYGKFACKVILGDSLYERCENKEVICYRKGYGLSCNFKSQIGLSVDEIS